MDLSRYWFLLFLFILSCANFSNFNTTETLPPGQKNGGVALVYPVLNLKDEHPKGTILGEILYEVPLFIGSFRGGLTEHIDFRLKVHAVGARANLKYRFSENTVPFPLAIAPGIGLSFYSRVNQIYLEAPVISDFTVSKYSKFYYGLSCSYHAYNSKGLDKKLRGMYLGPFAGMEIKIKKIRVLPEVVVLKWVTFHGDAKGFWVVQPGIAVEVPVELGWF